MPDINAYREQFPARWEFERSEDGVLEVTFKELDLSGYDENGYSRPWLPEYGLPLQAAEPLWNYIADDETNKIVILTGYEGSFYQSYRDRHRQGHWDAKKWRRGLYGVTRSLLAFLDVPTVLIGAANGPARVHAEYLLLCDLVVAGESAVFQDRPHFIANAVPGDGVNVVWPMLLGPNRARDFLLTGREISAHEALDLGLVREVVPDADLLPRCHELARELLKQDELTLRYTATVLREQIKTQVQQYMPYSMALEGIVFMEQSRHRPR